MFKIIAVSAVAAQGASSSMADTRCRYSGGVQPLVDALLPLATSPGWFRYAEAEGKGAQNPKALKQFAGLWKKFRKLQDNLSFNKTTMTAATTAVMKAKQQEWQLDEKQKCEQPQVMSNRIRLACRHVCQALCKKAKPKWICEIFANEPEEQETPPDELEYWEDEGEEEEEEVKEVDGELENEEDEEEQQEREEEEQEEDAATGASEAAKGKQKPGDWAFWGWDQELESAWRSREWSGHVSRNKVEHSKIIVYPLDPKPHKFMLARFGNVDYVLTDLTVEDWDLRQKALGDKVLHTAASPPLWETEHASSGLQVTIRRRADRQPLVSLYHGTSQICQVPEKAFDDTPAAVAFLKVIGQKFASEGLPSSHIYKLRNEMAKAQGISLQTRVMKRPASAVTGSSEAASSSATQAVTGSSEPASSSASQAVTGSSEAVSGSAKRKRYLVGPERDTAEASSTGAQMKKDDFDKKMAKTKHEAARVCKKPAQASTEGDHEDDEHEDDDVDGGESDFGINEPPEIGFFEQDLLLLEP